MTGAYATQVSSSVRGCGMGRDVSERYLPRRTRKILLMDIAPPVAIGGEIPDKRGRGRPKKVFPPPPDVPEDRLDETPRPPLVDPADASTSEDDDGSGADFGESGLDIDLHEPSPGLPPERAPSVERPPRPQYDVTLARTAPPP